MPLTLLTQAESSHTGTRESLTLFPFLHKGTLSPACHPQKGLEGFLAIPHPLAIKHPAKNIPRVTNQVHSFTSKPLEAVGHDQEELLLHLTKASAREMNGLLKAAEVGKGRSSS